VLSQERWKDDVPDLSQPARAARGSSLPRLSSSGAPVQSGGAAELRELSHAEAAAGRCAADAYYGSQDCAEARARPRSRFAGLPGPGARVLAACRRLVRL